MYWLNVLFFKCRIKKGRKKQPLHVCRETGNLIFIEDLEKGTLENKQTATSRRANGELTSHQEWVLPLHPSTLVLSVSFGVHKSFGGPKTRQGAPRDVVTAAWPSSHCPATASLSILSRSSPPGRWFRFNRP